MCDQRHHRQGKGLFAFRKVPTAGTGIRQREVRNVTRAAVQVVGYDERCCQAEADGEISH